MFLTFNNASLLEGLDCLIRPLLASSQRFSWEKAMGPIELLLRWFNRVANTFGSGVVCMGGSAEILFGHV